MPSFFRNLKGKFRSSPSPELPPQWTPAPEPSHERGKLTDVPEDEYAAAEQFCLDYPVEPPRLLPSDAIDRINEVGCRAWGLETPSTSRFSGHIQNDSKGGPGVVTVRTTSDCMDVCLLSDLPILSGLYGIQGKVGIYYEIHISRMDGVIAIGTSCRPYPSWRLPGWNRLSPGFHLDDFRKFFEDPDGGRDYTDAITHIEAGDTIGCGYEFQTGSIFFTYNGVQLPSAFTGIYMPRQNHDVYAAIGVQGACDFQVNFGGELFRWKAGNEWAWRVEGHVGRLSNTADETGDELPAYA